MCQTPFLRAVCRECYSQAAAVYEKLKRLGMDLVTTTGHDSIDAAEELRSRPDFFLSEEVTCVLPGGNQLLSMGGCMVRETPWTAALLTLALAVRAVTLGNYVVESVFARWWMARYLERRASRLAAAVAEAA